jgi:hypothetical protein
MKKCAVLFVALLTGAILCFTSCSKNGATGPEGAPGTPGSPGPSFAGDITGHVNLFDEYGGQQFGNASAAKVYIYNAGSTKAFDSTIADSGLYSFANISTGTYTMLYTAQGYGSVVNNSFGFIGGGNINFDAHLSQIPNFFVTSVSVDSINHLLAEIVINCTLDTLVRTKERELLVFIGSDSTVSSLPTSYLSVYPATAAANTTSVTILIPLSDIYNSILVSGKVPYFAIYAATNDYNTASVYEDLPTGKMVYTALNPRYAPTHPHQPLP